MSKIGLFLVSLQMMAFAALGRADTVEPVKAEVARLQQTLATKSSDPEWKETAPRIETGLTRSRKALDAGYLYQGLEELYPARFLIRVAEISAERPAATAAEFEVRWRRAGTELAGLDRQARALSWRGKPLALRALSESSAGKSMVLFDSSHIYAQGTKIDNGLNVIAQAYAAAEFATFCHSLAAPQPHAPLALRSLRPDLAALQERVRAAFQPPRSIELHPQFIRLNATLKVAGELDAARRWAGALFQYLDAVQQFGLLDAMPPDASRQARIRATLTSWGTRVARSMKDDSIAEIFLERAAMALAPGGEASPDDWKKAAVIAEQVVPAYQAAIEAPAGKLRLAAAKPAVTVTLVRWPFT
jgi:hypothetical protein